jgi:signal transduction histidine kinase
MVQADFVLLRQALGCLLDNAVRFTPPDGSIRVSASADAEVVTVTVADNGIGLEPGQLASVFEPFFKADASRHDRTAPGLGLAIAQTLIEKHHGTIWAESAGIGHGARFCFTIARQPCLEGNL